MSETKFNVKTCTKPVVFIGTDGKRVVDLDAPVVDPTADEVVLIDSPTPVRTNTPKPKSANKRKRHNIIVVDDEPVSGESGTSCDVPPGDDDIETSQTAELDEFEYAPPDFHMKRRVMGVCLAALGLFLAFV